MYYYPSSQTAALLILKCPTEQSVKKVPTRGIRREKNNHRIKELPPLMPLTIYQWDAISPRMSDGAAGNSLLFLSFSTKQKACKNHATWLHVLSFIKSNCSSPNPQVSRKTISEEGANEGGRREKQSMAFEIPPPHNALDPLLMGRNLSEDERWCSEDSLLAQ
ncbi:hypothetical protein CDAR_301821 [Caerostris darwini]|uniref:Uncharacterized protein n=1 Tax=Caerostris darwini TaxID=1538125 RepID=A0AAV4VF08_9ARAC|nr:hypothetical protein CDAR_301821 [Caerostris darwini]